MAGELNEFIQHCAYGDEEAIIDMLKNDTIDIDEQNDGARSVHQEGEHAFRGCLRVEAQKTRCRTEQHRT